MLLTGLRSLLVLSCVACHVGSVAHHLIVRHDVCAEHGEMVEIGPGHEGRPTVPLQGRSTSVTPLIAASHAGEPHGEHDHCALIGERRDHAVVAGHASIVLSLPTSFLEPLIATARPRGPIPILQLAPKASPPV